MHKRECEKFVTLGTDTRFMYYIFALSALILLYRCLASYSDAGSYCFAAATCGLQMAGRISGVQYVSGTCYSVILGT
jgi:hypothetical protein